MAATRKKKGVAQSSEPQVPERQVSGVTDPESEFNKSRLAQLEEISEKNSEERKQYAEYHGINPPEEEAPAEEPEEPEEVEAQAEEAEKPEEQEETEGQPAERMVKIKVDGREQEVPESKILEEGRRAMQKEVAADKRLQEATELLRQAKEQFGQMAQPSAPKQTRDLSRMDDLELARRIQMGTEDEAAEAVAVMRDRETVSPDNVASMVESRVLAKLKFEEVRNEYSDVLDDHYLQQLAVMEDQRMIAEGDSRMPHERLPDIAKTLREWRGPKSTGKVVVGDLEQRRSAKAAAASIPSAHGKKSAAQSEQKPQTREQIIEEMRKARGQSI